LTEGEQSYEGQKVDLIPSFLQSLFYSSICSIVIQNELP